MKNIIKNFLACNLLLLFCVFSGNKAHADVITATLSGGLSGPASMFTGGTFLGVGATGSFDLTFGNLSSGGSVIPASALQIKATVPIGIAFQAYTPPAGWSYTITDAQNAILTNTGSIGILFTDPTSTATFHIPIKTVGAIASSTYVAFLANTGPLYTMPSLSAGINLAQGTVTVNNVPLSISISSFKLSSDASCKVNLSWSVGVAREGSRFEVERSMDGSSYSSIGSVKITDGDLKYSFIDTKPAQGYNMYRVRQVDVDSRYSLSIVETIKMDCNAGGISAYPNPTSGIVYVTGLTSKSTIRVINVLGQNVMEREVQNTQEGLNMSGLTSGIYQIQVIDGGKPVFNTKIVKK